MADAVQDVTAPERPATAGSRWRHVPWVLVVLADAGLLLWGAMAALAPERLLGPGSAPILPAGYEGYTGQPWREVATAAPRTASFMTLLFRMYGAYGVAFAVMAIAVAVTAFRRRETWAWWALLAGNTLAYGGAMTYDRVVHAIGPFEALEYVAIAAVYVALAGRAPFRAGGRPARSAG